MRYLSVQIPSGLALQGLCSENTLAQTSPRDFRRRGMSDGQGLRVVVGAFIDSAVHSDDFVIMLIT